MTYICLELVLVTKLRLGVFENGRIDKVKQECLQVAAV